MSGTTNTQIYNELIDFRTETRKKLDDLNGRVRSNEKSIGIALDRTKRIGEEIDHHSDDDDAHGGGTARINTKGLILVAIITALGGFLGTLIANGGL